MLSICELAAIQARLYSATASVSPWGYSNELEVVSLSFRSYLYHTCFSFITTVIRGGTRRTERAIIHDKNLKNLLTLLNKK